MSRMNSWKVVLGACCGILLFVGLAAFTFYYILGGDLATKAVTTPIIPDDVSYTIIESKARRGIKHSLDVRLSRKVSEETLRAIALELKSRYPQRYDRTFMTYYLPGMDSESHAWATTHFDPDLEVRILGLTTADEVMLTDEPEPADRETIGRWLHESPSYNFRITIFRENGKLFAEQTFPGGSTIKHELNEKKIPRGRRFDEVDSGSGDHYVVDTAGNLQIRDNEGLVSETKRIP